MYIHSISFNGFNLNMNYILITCCLISSLSFLGYAVSYFTTPHMKQEFERFNLKHLGLFIIILEITGALGLLVGLYFNPILILAAGGLCLLMFLGLLTRLKLKDSLWVSLPALFYMLLNGYIFYLAIGL